jgi:hypothetical protein
MQYEAHMTDKIRVAAAQEFLEILTYRAQRSGRSPAQILREQRQHLFPLAELTSDVHLKSVVAELDHQAAKLELEA